MRLLVEQSALQRAAARAASVVSRTTIPILNNILIDAEGQNVWLVGTDLDRTIQARLEAVVERKGQATVPAGNLGDIARNAPKGAEIQMSLDDDDPRLQVKFGRSRYRLPVLPAGDFPVQPSPTNPASFELLAAELTSLMARTHFAQSTEETRYYLCGTRLEVVAVEGQPMLRMVATDGHRLALDEHPAAAGVTFPGISIPRQTIGEMRRLLEGFAGSVMLSINERAVEVATPDVRLISKTLDGSYPDYSRVIPREWDSETELDREAMIHAVRRVALINAEKAKSLKMTLASDRLALTVRNAEAGDAAEEIEIDYGGPPMEIGFNARYVLDALDQTDARRVVLRLAANTLSPGRLDPHPADTSHTGALCVLMPLRV